MGSRATARTIASARGLAMRSASGSMAGVCIKGDYPGLPSWAIQSKEGPMSILVLLIVLILVFGVGDHTLSRGI